MVREVCFTGFERAKVHGRMGRCSLSKSTISLTGFLFFFSSSSFVMGTLPDKKNFPLFIAEIERERKAEPLGL